MKLTEEEVRQIVREEIERVIHSQKKQRQKKRRDEAVQQAFDPEKMRRTIESDPKLEWIWNNEDIDLKTLYDREIVGNARLERKYMRYKGDR